MAAGKPWWQTTKTARLGFGLGSFWAIEGLGNLLVGLVGRGHAWNVVIGVGGLMLAVVYIASAVALFRRERSSTASATPGEPTSTG